MYIYLSTVDSELLLRLSSPENEFRIFGSRFSIRIILGQRRWEGAYTVECIFLDRAVVDNLATLFREGGSRVAEEALVGVHWVAEARDPGAGLHTLLSADLEPLVVRFELEAALGAGTRLGQPLVDAFGVEDVPARQAREHLAVDQAVAADLAFALIVLK